MAIGDILEVRMNLHEAEWLCSDCGEKVYWRFSAYTHRFDYDYNRDTGYEIKISPCKKCLKAAKK